MNLGFLGVALAVTQALASGSTSQKAEPKVTPAPVEEVVVTGKRDKPEPNRAKVERLIATPSEIQMARWNEPVCPVAFGLDTLSNISFAQHMRENAVSVGAPVASDFCSSNIIVVFTNDMEGAITKSIDQSEFYYGHEKEQMIREKLGKTRPVRWWFGYDMHQSNGQEVNYTLTRRGYLIPVERKYARSTNLNAPFRMDFTRAVVFVDLNKVKLDDIKSVGDFTSMVCLAEIKNEENFRGLSTVMNLFANGEQTDARLTDWDRGFLTAVYKLSPAAYAHTQRYVIAESLDRDARAGR